MSGAVAPYLESPPPRRERRTPGRCRICGCTDDAACIIGGGIPELGYTETCSWIEEDLCSRCHGPRRPTRWQAGELARIADRYGPTDVAAGYGGQLLVAFRNRDDELRQIRLDPGPPTWPPAREEIGPGILGDGWGE